MRLWRLTPQQRQQPVCHIFHFIKAGKIAGRDVPVKQGAVPALDHMSVKGGDAAGLAGGAVF